MSREDSPIAISWDNKYIVNMFFFLLDSSLTETKNTYILFFIFETIKDSYFIDLIFLKILTFQQFIFINSWFLIIFFSLWVKWQMVVVRAMSPPLQWSKHSHNGYNISARGSLYIFYVYNSTKWPCFEMYIFTRPYKV